MKYRGSLLAITMAVIGAYGADVELLTETTASVSSEGDLVGILESTQKSIQGVSPPSSGVYVDVKEIPLPVDWAGFSKNTTKYMTATMDEYGLPRYHLLLWEDALTRDRVIALASTGYEVARIAAPKDYQPEAYYMDILSRGGTYSEAMRWIFDPAHTMTEVVLMPQTLYPAYEQYEAEKLAQELVVLEATVIDSPGGEEEVSVGMALVPAVSSSVESESFVMDMAMTYSIPSLPGGDDTNSVPEGGASTSNLLVELTINLPEGFGYMDHIEIFSKDDLIYSTTWAPADDWVPMLGSQTVKWIDPTSSNKACSFFYISDGADTDGDGHSDLYEEWADTNPDVFDVVDYDADGINDWWENKLFGDLSQTLLDDTDGDGLTNHVEIVVDSMGRLVSMISNPALKDSDADGLEDKPERMTWFTDPLDPDTDGDGLNDAAEVLGSPRTDPHNSDAVSPIIALSGN